MLVHITAAGSDVRATDIATALERAGYDTSVGDDAGADQNAAYADAVVCVLGAGAEPLTEDGRLSVERSIATALDHRTPILTYAIAGPNASSGADRSGYAVTRIEALRRRLGRVATTVRGRAELAEAMLHGLSQIGGSLHHNVPDAVRELHRRIRDHPRPEYDAFGVSLHNVDHLYQVPIIPQNQEIAGEFVGTEAGGAGANTMVALRRLGMSTAVAGAVGDDDEGAMLRRALEDDEVSTTLLVTVAGHATGRNVMIRTASGYLNVVLGGANEHLDEEIGRRGMRRLLEETAAQSRVMHFSAFTDAAGQRLQESLLHAVPDETIVSYKPGTMDAERGIDQLAAVFRRCDLLFIGDTELDTLLMHAPGFAAGMPVTARLDLLFSWRMRRGISRPLLVTVMTGMENVQAEEPVRLYWGSTEYEGTVGPGWKRRGGPIDIKDVAGARDAIAAGVIFGLLRSRPPTDCVNLAFVLAISTFAEYGCRGALPRATDVRENWRKLIDDDPPRWLSPYG